MGGEWLRCMERFGGTEMAYADAASAINAAVDEQTESGEVSPSALAAEIQRKAKHLEAEEQAKVQEHIAGVRNISRDAVIETLDPGVGGLYDGSISIAASTMKVDEGGDVSSTVAQMEETSRHEEYHKQHDHLAPKIVGPSAGGGAVVTIGGKAFSDTALIEGLTVTRTGDQFVSDGYRQYKQDLLEATSAAGLSVGDVEAAVDEQDLSSIDDWTRFGIASALEGRSVSLASDQSEDELDKPTPVPVTLVA